MEENNFMTEENVRKAIETIKLKNCEGSDRIPQRLLVDGINVLIKPLTVLFNKIYAQRKLPSQWLLSK